MIRPFQISDTQALKEIHVKAGYGFDFPELSGMVGAQTVEDENGRVVGYAAGQKEAQIIGIFDPAWGTPGERMLTFAALHQPIAEELAKQGVKEVYVAIDPKFPSFGRRLMSFGWKKALWNHYFCPLDDIAARFGRKAAA